MSKGWKTAPWIIRGIFLFWVIPLLVFLLIAFWLFIDALNTKSLATFRMINYMLEAIYKSAPIYTVVGIILFFIMFAGGVYSLFFLKGSFRARNILEIFAWILVLTSVIYFLFPQLSFISFENTPIDSDNLPLWKILPVFLFIILEVAVLSGLRCKIVNGYICL